MALGPFHQASVANVIPTRRLFLTLRRFNDGIRIWILDQIFIFFLLLFSMFESGSSDRGRDEAATNENGRCCAADGVLMLNEEASGAKDSTWRLIESTTSRITNADGQNVIS